MCQTQNEQSSVFKTIYGAPKFWVLSKSCKFKYITEGQFQFPLVCISLWVVGWKFEVFRKKERTKALIPCNHPAPGDRPARHQRSGKILSWQHPSPGTSKELLGETRLYSSSAWSKYELYCVIIVTGRIIYSLSLQKHERLSSEAY